MREGHSSMSAGHTCSTDTGPLALVALKNTMKRKKIESEIQTFFEVKKNEADKNIPSLIF